MEKTCTLCGEVKDNNLFPKNKGMRDGYLNHCKVCVSARKNNKLSWTGEYSPLCSPTLSS